VEVKVLLTVHIFFVVLDPLNCSCGSLAVCFCCIVQYISVVWVTECLFLAQHFAKELFSHCIITWYKGFPCHLCRNMCGLCLYSTGHASIRFQQHTPVRQLHLMLH